MSVKALRVAFASLPLVLPLPVSAGAFFAFSGTVGTGGAENTFGFAGTVPLDGQSFSGTLRIGGILGVSDSFAAGFDDTFLTFTAAHISVTLNGVTETATVLADPFGAPFTLDVYNGINPRFGLDSTGFDDLYIAVVGASASSIVGISLAIEAGVDAVPGGAPGVPFSVATNTGSIATINGFVLAAAISSSASPTGFFVAATDFSLALVSVPTPGAVALFGAGLLGLSGLARRRRAG